VYHPITTTATMTHALEAWCGSFDAGFSWDAAISPCWLESTLALVLIVVGGLTLVQQARKLQGPAAETYQRVTGMTGIEAGTFLGASFLVVLHVAHLAVSITLHPQLLFHIGYQATAALLWLGVAVVTWHASKSHHLLENRPLFTTATLVYLTSTYIYSRLYVHPHEFPTVYIKAQLWTAVLQLVLVSLLTVAEFKRIRAAAAPSGYTSLPDVEAGVQKKKRTWVSLFVDACG
jgi:hypothetical protein